MIEHHPTHQMTQTLFILWCFCFLFVNRNGGKGEIRELNFLKLHLSCHLWFSVRMTRMSSISAWLFFSNTFFHFFVVVSYIKFKLILWKLESIFSRTQLIHLIYLYIYIYIKWSEYLQWPMEKRRKVNRILDLSYHPYVRYTFQAEKGCAVKLYPEQPVSIEVFVYEDK